MDYVSMTVNKYWKLLNFSWWWATVSIQNFTTGEKKWVVLWRNVLQVFRKVYIFVAVCQTHSLRLSTDLSIFLMYIF